MELQNTEPQNTNRRPRSFNKARSDFVRSLLDVLYDKYVERDIVTVGGFAQMVGVTRAQVYNWKKGASAPTDLAMSKIIIAMDKLNERE